MLANQALNYLVGGKVAGPARQCASQYRALSDLRNRDGHIIIAVGTDRQFKEYCDIIGVAELADDERFNSNRGRVENRDALIPLLAGPMKARTTAAWVAALEAAAVPCGPINTIDQMFADPQVLARGLQIGLTRDDGVQMPGVANPIQFSATPVEYEKAPPKLGDGTDSVLRQVLGFTEAEIARLEDSGAIG